MTGRRARGVVALAAACLGLVPPSWSASGAASDATVRAWLLSRTTNHASAYTALVGWLEDATHPGWAASVELYGTRRTGYADLVDGGEEVVPSAYADGTVVGCGGQPSGSCYSPLRALGFYEAYGSYSNGRSAPTTVLIVAGGINPTLSLTRSGWRARPWRGRVQRALAAESGAIGVQLGSNGVVESGGSSALRGGVNGSVAIAQPACQSAPVQPIDVGIGTATLRGGVRPSAISCPSTGAAPS